jgi:hypothetical protein
VTAPRRVRTAVVRGLSLGVLAVFATPAQAQPAGLSAAEALVRAAVRAQGSGNIVVTRVPLGCATVVRAALEPSPYPGAGWATVIVGPDGQSYGARARDDVAPLLRACGWLRRAPSVAEARAILSEGWHDGQLATRGDPAVSLVGGRLRISARRAEVLSNTLREDLVLDARPRAPARLVRVPLVQPEPPARPFAELLRAAERDPGTDALTLQRAIQASRGSGDAGVRASLSAISAWAGTSLVADCISALGPSDDTAQRLGHAWAALSPDARTERLELARGLLGAPVGEAIAAALAAHDARHRARPHGELRAR